MGINKLAVPRHLTDIDNRHYLTTINHHHDGTAPIRR